MDDYVSHYYPRLCYQDVPKEMLIHLRKLKEKPSMREIARLVIIRILVLMVALGLLLAGAAMISSALNSITESIPTVTFPSDELL